MSTTLEAKFFYGYVQPVREDENYEPDYDEEQEEDAWSIAHGMPGIKWKDQKALPYEIGWYGVSRSHAFYLAIKEVHFEVEYSQVKRIEPAQFQIKPEWEAVLRDAAKQWNLDLTGLTPGWHLALLFAQ